MSRDHTPGERETLEVRQKKQLDSNAPHVDVDELYTSDGLFALISQRRSNGTFTFAVFRCFERDGVERTSFIPESQGESYLALTQRALERIGKIRHDGTAPFKERARP